MESLPSVTWSEWLRWLLRRRRRLRVGGRSMIPALRDGDLVFVDPRAYRKNLPRRGEIVVAHHPYVRDQLLIKRVSEVDKDGGCMLSSDNPSEGTDSRAFGALPLSQLVGRVTCRIDEP